MNQLEFPIRVRQHFQNDSEGKEIVIESNSNSTSVFQKELHLDKEVTKKKSKNALDFKIQYAALPSLQDDAIYNSSPRVKHIGEITSEDDAN